MKDIQPRPTRQVAKVIVIDPVRRAALILRLNEVERVARDIDEWHLAGGSFEPDQDADLAATARRETSEETGLEVRILRELGHAAWDALYQGEPTHFEATIFLAEVEASSTINRLAQPRVSIEHSEAAWVRADELADYPALTPEARQFIPAGLTLWSQHD